MAAQHMDIDAEAAIEAVLQLLVAEAEATASDADEHAISNRAAPDATQLEHTEPAPDSAIDATAPQGQLAPRASPQAKDTTEAAGAPELAEHGSAVPSINRLSAVPSSQHDAQNPAPRDPQPQPQPAAAAASVAAGAIKATDTAPQPANPAGSTAAPLGLHQLRALGQTNPEQQNWPDWSHLARPYTAGGTANRGGPAGPSGSSPAGLYTTRSALPRINRSTSQRPLPHPSGRPQTAAPGWPSDSWLESAATGIEQALPALDARHSALPRLPQIHPPRSHQLPQMQHSRADLQGLQSGRPSSAGPAWPARVASRELVPLFRRNGGGPDADGRMLAPMPTGSGVEAVRERLRSAVEREAQLRMEAEMKALEVEVLVEQKAALESQLQQERDLRTSMEQELQHVKAALEAELAHPARQQSRELQWELRGAHSAIRALERQVAAAQVDAKAESERRMRLEKQAESERRLWRQPMAPLALGPPPSSPPDHVNAARGQLEQLEPGLGSALKLLQQLSAQAANKQAQQATPLQPQPAAVASPYQPSPHGTPTPAHCPEPPHLIRQAGANEQRIPAVIRHPEGADSPSRRMRQALDEMDSSLARLRSISPPRGARRPTTAHSRQGAPYDQPQDQQYGHAQHWSPEDDEPLRARLQLLGYGDQDDPQASLESSGRIRAAWDGPGDDLRFSNGQLNAQQAQHSKVQHDRLDGHHGPGLTVREVLPQGESSPVHYYDQGPHAMRRDPLSNTYMHNRGSQEWAGGHRPFPISPNKMTEEVLRRARIEYFEEKNRVRAKRLQELEQLQAAAPQQSA